MKRITVDLECSHTATVDVNEVPAQPNHLHVYCGTCLGKFSALRVTSVGEIPTRAIGDTVRLVSGGPEMTITAIDGDRVTCEWENEGKADCADFADATLVPFVATI